MAESIDELLLEKEWRRCFPQWGALGDETLDERIERLMEAFEYFCSTYWHVKHPSQGRIKFVMRDAQVDTVFCWLRERMTLALKARQIGFSTLSGAFAFWLTFGYADRAIIMLSRTERDAAKLLQKSTYGYRFLPDWMKLRGPIVNSNMQKMSMTNESYIESLPSASEPARGESVFLVFVDEIGFLPNSEEAWASIEPIADVGAADPDPLGGGRIIMLGTANGEGNLLHREWVRARGPWGNGTGRFYGIFHNWRANSDRDDAWYAEKKRTLEEHVLAQEYPDNPDEAFLKSGRPVFNLEALRAIEPEDPRRGFLQQLGKKQIEFVEDGGPLRIWVDPIPNHRYSMGVDVAEGLEHGDYSSAHVIDASTGEVVAAWHGKVDPDVLGSEILPLLGQFYNNALAVVESNNHGLTTLHALQRERYFPIYRRRRLASRQRLATDVMGWATTAVSKPLAIDELGKAIRDSEIVLLDQETIAELRQFVREGNGKMHGSPHDDRVMSLAISVQGLKHVHLHEYRVKDVPGPGTFGWWMNQTNLWEEEEKGEPAMGSYSVRAS